MRFALVLAGLTVGVALFACGGSVKNGSSDTVTPVEDAGTDSAVVTPIDASITNVPEAAPNPSSTTYPADHPPLPPVTYNGGNIIDAPDLITVTFDGDVQRTYLEAFGNTILTTSWWTQVTNGYCDARGKCVGPGTADAPVHLSSTPNDSYADAADPDQPSTLKTFIQNMISQSILPPPTAETIYLLYFPASVTITLDGDVSCDQFGAYHNAMTDTVSGNQFAYAVMPRCGPQKDLLTFAASHEIIESATDPFIPPGANNYDAYGSDSDAWDVVGGGGEVGDRCVDITGGGQDKYLEGVYTVQRIWNNVAAAASHDPCVPAPSPATQPYFNVAPDSDVLTMAFGETQTINLTAFSDGPTSPFQVDLQEITQEFGGGNVLTLSIDNDSLQNGQTAHISVTLNESPAQGLAAFLATSSVNGVSHLWPFVVQTQ